MPRLFIFWCGKFEFISILSLILYFLKIGNIRHDGHGIIGIIYDKARLAPVWLFDVLPLDIINLCLCLILRLGIPACQRGCLLKGSVRQLLSLSLYDTWDPAVPFA